MTILRFALKRIPINRREIVTEVGICTLKTINGVSYYATYVEPNPDEFYQYGDLREIRRDGKITCDLSLNSRKTEFVKLTLRLPATFIVANLAGILCKICFCGKFPYYKICVEDVETNTPIYGGYSYLYSFINSEHKIAEALKEVLLVSIESKPWLGNDETYRFVCEDELLNLELPMLRYT